MADPLVAIATSELRSWRQQVGLTQQQASERCGLSAQRLGALETLRAFPTERERARLVAVTGITERHLFPAWVPVWHDDPEDEPNDTVTSLTVVSPREPDYSYAALMESVDLFALRTELDAALATLSPRDRRLLEFRFGLHGAPSMTLQQVAEQFGVTKERIRQLETRALRLLRHPSRADHLRLFVWEEPPVRPPCLVVKPTPRPKRGVKPAAAPPSSAPALRPAAMAVRIQPVVVTAPSLSLAQWFKQRVAAYPWSHDVVHDTIANVRGAACCRARLDGLCTLKAHLMACHGMSDDWWGFDALEHEYKKATG